MMCDRKNKNWGATKKLPSLKTILTIAFGLFLFACAGEKTESYEEKSVDSLYNEAMDSVLDGNYLQAANQFFEVERQHPYSVWAAKSQVMGAYAYFRLDRYDDTINAADRFIQLHPSNPDAPYAFYLRSLAYYEQIVDVSRDQGVTQQALQALEDVIRRYPDSKYARDAALKLDLTRDHLAGKEMSVGRFYLKKGELAAAINRFKRVVEQYQTTSHVPEALLRMAECYSALGVKDEAKRVVAILGYNFPGSSWYADAYRLIENLDKDGLINSDARPFYKRWLNPEPKIAKAERRKLKGLVGIDPAINDKNTSNSSVQEASTSLNADYLRPWKRSELSESERKKFIIEAKNQEEISRNSAKEWRQAADNAGSEKGRSRASANASLAEITAEVWSARAKIVSASSPDDILNAEVLHAETSVSYWEAVLETTEDDLARDHAKSALSEAQMLLDHWKAKGQRPSWLDRMINSVL